MKYLFYALLLIANNAICQDFWSLPLKNAAPHGLASDEDTLWVSDYENDFIYRFDQSDPVPTQLPFAPGNPRRLTLNEEILGGVLTQILYVSTNDIIYRLNASTGVILSQFSSPSPSSTSFQGLAIGQNTLWVASRGTDDRIYRYDLTTQDWSGFFSAPGSNPRGLSFYDNSLWNVDSNDDLLYRLSPTNGSVLASFQIPFISYLRGLTFFQDRFHLSESTLQVVLPFQITEQYTNVYLAEKRLPLSYSNFKIPYLSSRTLSKKDHRTKRILIYQHGLSANAAVYLARAIYAAIQAESLNETLTLSLQILDDSNISLNPPNDLIYWTGGSAWGGLSASSSAPYPRSERISSFTILDQLLSSLIEDSS